MIIHKLINLGIKKLSNTSNSAALDAEVILSHVLDKSKEYLLINPDKSISPKLEQRFNILIQRRKAGWPVAYLTNQKEFMGLKFFVDRSVLIPRPETEGLVELVLSHASRFTSHVSILDIGTGSGVIIISIAKTLSAYSRKLDQEYFASDISTRALKIAKQNAKAHKVKITFKRGSLLAPWKKQHFDIIVANLPYLARETDSSTKFEPKRALIAKKNGLALIKELFRQIHSLLYPHPSALFLEIGNNQKAAIKKLAAEWLPEYCLTISKDLTGRSRYAALQKYP